MVVWTCFCLSRVYYYGLHYNLLCTGLERATLNDQT